jgi:signal transduction histidine kinase
MQKRDEIIRNMLRQEVANKSVTSSIAFALFSIFIFIYPFGCVQFKPLIQSITVFIFFISIVRYLLCRKLKQWQSINERQWQVLKYFIWLNSLGWCVIFNVASFELRLSGIHFIVVTTMIAGFVGASLNTLSYFSFLFIPFQAMLLIPQIGIILYYYYFAPEHLNYLPLIILYTMYFAYQVKQYLDFREENLKRFHYQLDLEKANAELERSKEELIEQTVQLVHVSRLAAIGEMSAGIAHEINNPLTIMKGGAQIIEKSILRESYDTNSILKHSQKIQKAINRVTTIVRGLKNFSTASDSLPKEIVSLSEIIEDTVHFCDELLVSHNIRFEIDNIPDCTLKCHPVQISQVLINLIKNAQDVLAEDHIPDQERWIRLNFSLDKKNLTIQVINGGDKISDDIADQVFKPFFSTKPVNSGTGLGLSISQKIIKEHMGEISLDLSGTHTTFVIVHPIH